MKKLSLALIGLMVASPAFAEDVAAAATSLSHHGLFALASAIVLGLAALGGTIGQAKVGAAAMEGIARNPQAAKTMNTPMILSLVFIESLVILSFVIAILIQGKF